MSVKIMGAVFDSDLPRDEKFILLSYADHAAHDGTGIYPSVRHTVWKTGYSTRSVRTITQKLIEKKILIPDGSGPHGVNRYRMDTSALPEREDWGVQFLPPAENDRGGMQKTTPRGADSASNPSESVNEPSYTARAENKNPSLAAEETGEELQQEQDHQDQDQHQEQDTSFDAIMGERQHYIPRGDPVQSSGDWAAHRREQPWATWGEHSKEAQAQFARRDGEAQSLRRLGYELDTTLGLRPLWRQKKSVASWFVGLANCLAEAEGDVAMVLEAANHLREQEMTLSSPHSLVKTTSALAAKRRSGSGTITLGL